ncbi:MAG: CDP-alcohol phosphatidyltransferase family protein [Methanobacteriota archaeon]
MVTSAFRASADKVTIRFGRVLGAAGVSPNAVTAASLVLAVVAGYLLSEARLLLGLAVFVVAGVLDAMDGAVARATGRVTKVGGYFDSLIDRYADAALFLGAALYVDTRVGYVLATVALVGTMATSYAKARAYQDARPPVHGWPDLLERTERLVILGAGIGIEGLAPYVGRTVPGVLVAFGVLALLTNVTVAQRARRAMRYIAESRE